MSGDLRLEKPTLALEGSYRSLVAELHARGEPLTPFVLTYPADDFKRLLERLDKEEKGIDLPAGFVPCSTFWLVRDGEIVAVSSVRHRLSPTLEQGGGHIGYGVRPSARRKGFGTEILSRTLPHARSLGVTRALVTCATDNVASAKIIVACGGVFEGEQFVPAHDEVVRRYWISL